MCGGGNAPAPPQPVYTATDGSTYADPNAAQNQDRALQLAATMGYAAPTGGTPASNSSAFSDWQQANPTFATYNAQGLTGADYQNQQAIIQQQQEAAAAQAQQTANIAASTSAIDNAFGGYDDAYYKNIGDTVQNYYQPQVDQQDQAAQQALTYKFANQGNTQSSAYTNAQALLNQQDALQTSNVANEAANAETQAKEQVGSAEQNLLQEANTGADPASVNTDLNNEDSQLKAYAPTLTPMGQVFTNYLTPLVGGIGSAVAGYQQGSNSALFNTGAGSASQTLGQS